MAWADGVRDTCVVTVDKKAVTGVTLSSTSKTMMKNEMSWLTASVSPSNSAYADVTWTSSDTSVVTVSSKGIVSAISAGSATITATVDDKSATCAITVQQPVTKVTLSSASKQMTVGNTETFSATVTPGNAANVQVTWTSTDASVATVDSTGKVTAKSVGIAVIMATADGNTDACGIVVNDADDTQDNDSDDNDSDDNSSDENGDSDENDNSQDSGDTDNNGDMDESEDPPDTGDDTQTITSEAIEESEDEPQIVIVYIDVSELPEGTESVRLADGSVVEIEDGTLKLEMDEGYLGKDGSMKVVALDSEGTPLGDFNVDMAQPVSTPNSGISGFVWLLIGIVGTAAIAVALYFLLIKKRLA